MYKPKNVEMIKKMLKPLILSFLCKIGQKITKHYMCQKSLRICCIFFLNEKIKNLNKEVLRLIFILIFVL